MRKIFLTALFFLSFFFAAFWTKPTYAATCSLTADPASVPYDYNGKVNLTAKNCFSNTTYTAFLFPQSMTVDQGNIIFGVQKPSDPNHNSTITINLDLRYRSMPGPLTARVCLGNVTASQCANPQYVVAEGSLNAGAAPTATPTTPPTHTETLPRINFAKTNCTIKIGDDAKISVSNMQANGLYTWWVTHSIMTNLGGGEIRAGSNSDQDIIIPGDKTANASPGEIDDFCIYLHPYSQQEQCVTLTFTASPPDGDVSCLDPESPFSDEDTTIGKPAPTNPPLPCDERGKDGQCLSLKTAIGNISTDPAEFVQFIYGIVLGLAGGIALIMIIISGYKFMASQGNPEAIKAATEGLTSAIVGLLFIIFAFVILQIVGVDILRIPGFTK